MFLLIILAVLVTSVLGHVWIKRDVYKLSLQMPGPFMLPLMGSIHLLIGTSCEEFMRNLPVVAGKFASPFRFWVGTKPYVIVSQPEDMRTVLNAPECLERGSVYQFIPPVLGDGVITMAVHDWKRHRKFMNSSFSVSILQSFCPIFNDTAKKLVKRVQECTEDNSKAVDFYKFMESFTLDTVCQTTMGSKMNIQEGQNTEYLEGANNLMICMARRLLNPFYHLDFFYKRSPLYKLQESGKKVVLGFVKKVVERKKADYYAAREERERGDDDRSPQVHIDQLLRLADCSEKSFTEEDVITEAGTLILTGFESTALSVSYCVLMIAMHSQVQARLHEEIVSVLGGRAPDSVKYEEVNEFRYMEQVIKETLRLFPVVPLVGRSVTAPFKLNDYTIPQGVNIVLAFMLMHRNESLWGPDAHTFDPEHFSAERVEKMHPYVFLPFSGGPRNCMGIKYAFLVMKIVLVHLLSRFEFSTDLKLEDLTHRFEVTLKLVNRHMVRVRPRTV
ncbi:probable cytochrome P450 313b1 [Phlebotomus argentipes]|uniref:probable cytochrome P450 313b1 n=1 Tax=Phlebotomus argentipes TaxID=94469 RepID=UPI002892B0EA|nr:probable cytochrome P450 313b1 [Phlebotomus argentipes]